MNDSRILLVEDEALVGIEIKSSLQRLGYTRTNLVKSGEDALGEVREETPDLVLMDVNLAGDLDGIETTREIHNGYDGDVPVVFLTAYSSDSIIDRIRDTDAIGYIIKPIDNSDLETIAKTTLGDQQEGGLNSGQLFMKWVRKIKQRIELMTPTIPRIPV